jgi:hypothetical protein
MPAECKEFYSKPATQRVEVFKQYPVEKQYEIYKCGTTQKHPPDTGLAIYIAEGGEKNIPFLLEKLKTEDSEEMRRNVIFVFELMAGRGYLRGRKDVAVEVENAVAKMTIPFLKELSEESLKKINGSL